MPDEQQAVTPYKPQSEGLLAQVIAAAKDPSIDAGKMEALVKLVNSQQDRDREIEFNRDLNAAMMQMPVITKEGVIKIPAKDGKPERTQGRFARFEDIDRVCRPILQRFNLAVRFEVGEAGGTISVRPIISHANGHTERGEAMKLPLDTSGAKNNTQGAGSAVTYGKRYTYCAILNIITEGIDDDGRGNEVEVVLPHEREQLVLTEAEAAHEAGDYLGFFGRLGPKDRGWLIQNGHHERFGGQVSLPPAQKRAAPAKPRTDPPADNGQAHDDPPSVDQGGPPVDQGNGNTGGERRQLTPRQWVERFKADVDKCRTVPFLDDFMDGKRALLGKLKASDEALWEETQEAYRVRKAAIEDGRLM